MRVFFDHQTFSNQLYGGISRYFCELISGINKTEQHKAHLSLLWSNNIHLKEYNLSTLSYPFPNRHRLLQTSNQLFNKVDLKMGKYDIYHATYFNDFLINSTNSRPFVTTFYDMTYERLSHKFTELSRDTLIIEQKKKIASRAAHLIAISQSTKQDMIDILGISPEQITVIHLGSSFAFNLPDANYSSDTIEKPYLLYVGNRSGYKNFRLFLKAASSLIKKHQIAIICAGGGKFDKDEITLISSLSIAGLIKHVAIDDKILPDLYRRAIAFVFPSLYEGFGIPILEAFSCSCPCVLSSTSSLPEVGGDAALYINPLDNESIVDALERIITDTALRTDLIQRGQQRLSLFSWQNTVDQTISLYSKFI